MNTSQPSLYERLPAILRQRDASLGQPLRALVEVLDRELIALQVDAQGLWEDWFIETCEAWLVPYIGELLGVRGLRGGVDEVAPLRAFVANQIAYRRRKGTVAALEQLARDLTARPAVAREFFSQCIRQPHLRQVPGAATATVSCKNSAALTRIGTPFESFAHSADVRHIRSQRGRYNLPNVGLFVWPNEVHVVQQAVAGQHPSLPEAFYFDPLSRDVPLFAAPQTEDGIASLAQAEHVPRRLQRIDLWQAQQGDNPVPLDFAVVPADPPKGKSWRVEIANLSAKDGSFCSGRPAEDVVRVDPETGRIVFSAGQVPSKPPRVTYGYASPWRIGAGPFDRSSTWRPLWQTLREQVTFMARVNAQPLPEAANGVPSLAAAIDAWNDYLLALQPAAQASALGVIAVGDNRSEVLGSVQIELVAGARLYIVALAAGEAPGPSLDADLANGVRPVFIGNLAVHAQGSDDPTAKGGQLVLDGLVLAGQMQVAAGELARLDIRTCTITGPKSGVVVQSGGAGANAGLELVVVRSQCRTITGGFSSALWRFEDAIVHAADGDQVALQTEQIALSLRGCTVLGAAKARTIEASDCLFAGPTTVAQHQDGCLRYCYVPANSVTPPRYRCQPDGALQGVSDPVARGQVLARVRPEFESLDPAQPGYARLDPSTAIDLRTGSESRCEVGAGEHLRWEIRLANLHTALRQYFRFGLEAGIFLEP